MQAYIDDIIVTAPNGEKAKLYPRTKQEAVNGLVERLGAVEADVSALQTAEDITETTEATMPNSHKGRFMFEEIGGKSEQESTTGAQLLNPVNTTEKWVLQPDGGHKMVADGASYLQRLTLTAGTYTLSVETINNTGSIPVVIIRSPETSANYATNYVTGLNYCTYTFEADTAVQIVLQSINSKGKIPTVGCIAYVMLNAGDTALPWEPYTGAQASPNPSYPQEIRTVKGKNLLDCRGLAKQTANGVTITPIFDDNGNLLYAVVNGTPTVNTQFWLNSAVNLKAGKSYIISGGISENCMIRLNDGELVHAQDTGAGIVYTCPEDITIGVDVRLASGSTFDNVIIYPMIRHASVTDPTYVPYGLLRVKTRNEQLFDTSQAVDNKYQNDANYNYTLATNESFWCTGLIPCKPGTTIQISHVAEACAIFGYANNGVKHVYGGVTSVNIPANGVFIRFCFNKTTVAFGTDVMVNVGDVVLPWQPYQESSITLSEPIELCGIGDVQDVIDVENGVVRKRFGKVVFDGSENWYMDLLSELGTAYFYLSTLAPKNKALCLCTHFVNGTYLLGDAGTVCMTYINYGLRFYPQKKDMITLDDWKAWLAENPMTVIYELATEEITALPIADRIALNSLLTYDGVTHLEWDCFLEPTFAGEHGTSKVGGYALDGLLAGRNGEMVAISYMDRLNALESALINNI